MQRITITIDDELMDDVDQLIARRGYHNRSEAIRDLARAGIAQDRQRSNQRGDCVAAVVYAYEHAARELSKRLVKEMHGHHELTLATLHVHLDEENCLEVNVLKGAVEPRRASRRPRHRGARRPPRPCGDDPDRSGARAQAPQTSAPARVTAWTA